MQESMVTATVPNHETRVLWDQINTTCRQKWTELHPETVGSDNYHKHLKEMRITFQLLLEIENRIWFHEEKSVLHKHTEILDLVSKFNEKVGELKLTLLLDKTND